MRIRKHSLWFLGILFMLAHWLAPASLQAQPGASGDTLQYRILDTLTISARAVAADPLGNIFWINPQGVLWKRDPHSDSLYQYANWQSGIPEQVDVSNPLRILLFYPQSGILVLLSRWLTWLYTLDLKAIGILQPTAVASSYDNQIWVYDVQDASLKKISPTGTLLLRSIPLGQLVSTLPRPTRLIDLHGKIYAYDPQKGIYVFDELGNYLNHIPVSVSQSFAASEAALYLLMPDAVCIVPLQIRDSGCAYLPVDLHPIQIAVEPVSHRLLLLTPQKLYIFQLQ
ncbi:MAG: hypothetical protein K6T34_00025 [Thermoflavifilum sp.]|nr:hypothetical protein [Thermoflavifilum sp.]